MSSVTYIPVGGGGGGTAATTTFTPAGNLAADDVQEALQELDTEKLGKAVGASAGILTGGNEATATDGTGILQVGASGGANIGVDGSELQARSASAVAALALNPAGGQVTHPNGSLTNPGIAFVNSLNTGFYYELVVGLLPTCYLVVNGQTRLISSAGVAATFTNGTEATAADGSGELQLGVVGGANLGMDATEIQARNNNVAAPLALNPHGGSVDVGSGGLTVNGVTLAEFIADTTGAMFSSNTETGITATYDDTDNTIDLVVPDADETTKGLVERATLAEVQAGTDTTRFIDPADAEATYAKVYTHSAGAYSVAGGRIFIGTEDPSADGFTPEAGDIWYDPS